MPFAISVDEAVGAKARRLVTLLVGVFLVSLVVLLVIKWPRSDYDAYYRGAVRVANGETPYVLDEFGFHGTYRYPPALAYAMIPLTALDVATAGRLWFVFNGLLMAGTTWLVMRLAFGSRSGSVGLYATLLAVVACSCYVCQNLFQGQVSLAMTACCFGWALCHRTGRPFAGGTLLAAGVALKLAPLVLLPYLVLRKDWRGLAGVAFGGTLLALAPAPWVGLERMASLHREWLAHAKATQVPEQNYRPGNQGLMGMLARLPHVSNGRVCYSDDHLAAIERAHTPLVMIFAAGLYGWLAWDMTFRRKSLSSEKARARENRDLTLLFTFMTLAHPCAWRCNFLPLLLPCVLLARHAADGGAFSRLSRGTLLLVTAAWVWPALYSAYDLVLNRDALAAGEMTVLHVLKGRSVVETWSLVVYAIQGAHFWTALIVCGATLAVVRQPVAVPRGMPERSGVPLAA
jgi:hypothetical protein